VQSLSIQTRVTELSGKSAVVVGGTSGIGRAAALSLAELGADVTVAGRGRDDDDVAGQIRARGRLGAFVSADVGNATEVDALFASVVRDVGRLDMAVNAAASTAAVGRPIAELAEVEVEEQLRVTLKGTWLCMRAELRHMLASGGGAIVNVASTNALAGAANFAIYAAAKHGVVGLTRSAAREYARHGVRINAVCPGATETPMLAEAFAAETPEDPGLARAARTERIPLGRIAEASEVAAAIAWLCSPSAASVVGTALVVDGGDSA
jgi:NAD(P)-dependent dehydrogenase (short-subunit alcohol dehydrogenase family)